MTNVPDLWSRAISRGLDVIFAQYPARTGLGIVAGCALASLVRIFEPFLKSLTFADFAGTPWYAWVPIGVLIAHAKTIASLFGQRPTGSEDIDQVLDLIERSNISQAERRRTYRALIERAVKNIALSKEARHAVDEFDAKISATALSRKQRPPHN